MKRVYLEYLGDGIEIPIGETIVGRDVGCVLRFNDPAVSRRHIRFIHRHDELFVEDLASSNGTLVNNRLVVAPIRLGHNDTVVIGSRLITVRITDDDGLGASTLLLNHDAAENALDSFAPMNVTERFVVVRPKPTSNHQRCPACGAAVTELDDECANCNYQWGSFRPMSVTDVRATPQVVNRRRHDRQPIELSLVYSSSELEIEAITRDLSESGVFVCSQVLDPVGTACQLTLLVDGGPPVRTNGIVRRVVEHDRNGGEPIGLGVEFVNIGTNELVWIKSMVARMADENQPAL